MCSDPVFKQEQQHLIKTHETLRFMGDSLVEKMKKSSLDAAADKLAMCEEVAPNFASYSDAMETYADYATINRVIDAYNMTQSVDAEKLRSIQLLLKQPYFAKIVLQFKSNEDPKELYIGAAGVSDDLCRRMVVDWRSPVAEVYYNQENGATSYQANDRTINVDLKLRRQFDITKDTLNAYFDTTVAIQDSLLLASLSKQRTAHMKAITSTIQKEQNAVIRHRDVPTLLVRGIAGSGKTSVLMQRIAYLFYQQRETLDPSEVFLVTPNPVFAHYIDSVLPEMGERNPQSITWVQFLKQLMPPDRTGGKSEAPVETLQHIDQVAQTFVFEDHDFKEVCVGDVRFLSVSQIRQVAAKYKKIQEGIRRVVLMREELIKRVKSRLKSMAVHDDIFDEVSVLTSEEQLRFFHETFNPYDEEEVRAYAQRYVEKRYENALQAVENDDWIRVDRIGARLLGSDNLKPVEWLYLKMALTGLGNPHAKYVMIDEVQDYTQAQLMVLARYFRRARFLLLGDENQAISEGTATFDQAKQIFSCMCGQVEECDLMTSYRSTPEITEKFASLMAPDKRARVSSVRQSDEEPQMRIFESLKQRDEALGSIIEKASQEKELTAVIFPQSYLAQRLLKQIDSTVLQDTPQLIDDEASLPNHGVIFTTLKLAKGLEFDHVIVPDASQHVFSEDDLSRRRLYTTLSRATRKLTILSVGQPSSFLKSSCSNQQEK